MQLGSFERSPIGRLVRITGHDARQDADYDHYAFLPDPLPHEIPLSQATYKLLSEADRALGALKAHVELLPNPQLLVRPALTREAVSTSALEGTYAALSEVLEAEYAEERRTSAEVREVQNYVRAATKGIELIETMPICLRLVSKLQKILVARTRGDTYDSGRLRERQVYIGEEGGQIEESRFVPPPHGDVLRDGMSDWEKWINADDDVPLLVKAALGHYQFETLHPFSDGNGRLGRLLITLQLIHAGVLTQPVLNLSPWFEPRRAAYVDHLMTLSSTGDYNPWVSFFAQAVAARSKAASQTISALLGARERFLTKLRGVGAQGVVLDLAGDLIGFPRITVTRAAQQYGVTYPPANNAVSKLVSLGILREITGSNYSRVFACDEVYNIIHQG
ncbi:MAG: Fic/DOC family N-terminal domain-containing protein [Pseudonocardiaceae bacterium]